MHRYINTTISVDGSNTHVAHVCSHPGERERNIGNCKEGKKQEQRLKNTRKEVDERIKREARSTNKKKVIKEEKRACTKRQHRKEYKTEV